MVAERLRPSSVARRDGLGRRLAAKHAISRRGEPADQPVRLDRVVHPGRGATVGHARFNGLLRYFAAVPVEQGKLSAGLRQSALEIAPLRLGRPYAGRVMTRHNLARRGDVGALLALRCPTHGQPAVNDLKACYDQLPVITLVVRSKLLSRLAVLIKEDKR